MSPHPTSPSPLFSAAMPAGSGHSPETGAPSPGAGAPSPGASASHDGAALATPTTEGLTSHAVHPASGKHLIAQSPPHVSTAGAHPELVNEPFEYAGLKPSQHQDDPNGSSRVIKRYSNRKLYDTKSSRYVTLLQIAEMVRAGEEVRIIENRSKEDKTEATLALIISEELKASPRGIPLSTLRALIREGADCSTWFSARQPAGSEALWRAIFGRSHSAADGAQNGAGEPGGSEDGSEFMKDLTDAEMRANFERWCAAIDQRMRSLPDSSAIDGLEARVQHLNERLAELERRLGRSGE